MKLLQRENRAFAAKTTVEVRDLGFMGYRKAHEIQLQYVEKISRGSTHSEVILLTEHPAVFTLGRKGETAGFMRSQQDILSDGVDIVHTERGGDITYHGPGQIVVYPIINLHRRRLSVTRFIHILEDIMLSTAADFNVAANRDERNRGIWVGDKKLGSVGIRVRHGITFHGLALNVNLDLEPFRWINPCGLVGVGMTSLAVESGNPINQEDAKQSIKNNIMNFFIE